jgi:small subunit ribosomal protein S20
MAPSRKLKKLFQIGYLLMPWHASPKKRLRRDAKKHAQNKSQISTLRTLVKKTKESNYDASLLKKTQKMLDMAVSKGLIHRNAAARRVSRLMKQAMQKNPAEKNPAEAKV